MISSIKTYFKELIKTITLFTDDRVYLNVKDNYFYETCNFASVLSGEEKIEKIMTKENTRTVAGKIEVWNKKYMRTLPLIIALNGDSETVVSGWLDEFLEQLGSWLYIEKGGVKTAIEIIPREVAYSDSDSRMPDFYMVFCYIDCVFGTYVKEETVQISDIFLSNITYK